MPDYTAGLLAAFEAGKQKSEDESHPPPEPTARSLVEPLSQRELEVLRFVAQGLSNREIGERLFLAVITVKEHNRNIFRKLQVRRRTEATDPDDGVLTGVDRPADVPSNGHHVTSKG
jgi:LuxR family maltose regulon positive regulatory protein